MTGRVAARLPRGIRALAVAACAALVIAVALVPWYALDDYRPNGWDATWWARAAALAAIACVALLRLRRDREAALAAAVALGCVVFRVASPPDFGFGLDGLRVPVERLAGCWVGLASAALALAASARLAARARRESGQAPESSPEAPPPAASSPAATP